jgi:hypothetical protein
VDGRLCNVTIAPVLPLAQVEQLEVEHFSGGKTLLLVVLGPPIAVGLLFAAACIANPDGYLC